MWGSVLDKRGYLWFGLESRPEKPPAACYWDGEKLNLIELDVEATSQGKSIHRVLVDDTGKVWLAGYGLFRETRGGFGFEEVPCKFDDPILDFIQRRDCTFLIATDGGGLFGMRGGAMTRLASE